MYCVYYFNLADFERFTKAKQYNQMSIIKTVTQNTISIAQFLNEEHIIIHSTLQFLSSK